MLAMYAFAYHSLFICFTLNTDFSFSLLNTPFLELECFVMWCAAITCQHGMEFADRFCSIFTMFCSRFLDLYSVDYFVSDLSKT